MISIVGMIFVPSAVEPTGKQYTQVWWFAFQAQKMLVFKEKTVPTVPLLITLEKLGLHPVFEHYLGTLDGTPCFAAHFPEGTEPPADMKFLGLRSLFGELDDHFYNIAMRALSIVNWDNTHQFCGCCGSHMEKRSDILARQCDTCGFIVFPRISPAVIVLVERDKKVLLARASRFKENLYSVIAGFVEPGETLEETVIREIKEETGIDVKNIRYFGSQPWPFPNSLMIGFMAEYAGGEISVDGKEISEAGWYDAAHLPEIPPKISIARELIDAFAGNNARE